MQINPNLTDKPKGPSAELATVTDLALKAHRLTREPSEGGGINFAFAFKSGAFGGFTIGIERGGGHIPTRVQDLLLSMALAFNLTGFAVILEAWVSSHRATSDTEQMVIEKKIAAGELPMPSEDPKARDFLIGLRGDLTTTEEFMVPLSSEIKWKFLPPPPHKGFLDFHLFPFDEETKAKGIARLNMSAAEVKAMARTRLAGFIPKVEMNAFIKFDDLGK